MSKLQSIEQPGLCEIYISAAWKALAALAWVEFLANGRGFFFLDFSTMIVVKLDEITVDAAYITEAEIIDQSIELNLTLEFCTHLAHAVSVYEPDREVIFIAKMPDGSTRDYMVERKPYPPEAFLQMAEPTTVDVAANEVVN